MTESALQASSRASACDTVRGKPDGQVDKWGKTTLSVSSMRTPQRTLGSFRVSTTSEFNNTTQGVLFYFRCRLCAMCFIIIISAELCCYFAVIVVVWLYGCFVPCLLSHLCVLQRKVLDGLCLHSSAQRMCLLSITVPSPAVYSIKLYLYSVCRNKIVFRCFNLHSLRLRLDYSEYTQLQSISCSQQSMSAATTDDFHERCRRKPKHVNSAFEETGLHRSHSEDFYNSQLWAFLFYSKRELNFQGMGALCRSIMDSFIRLNHCFGN